MTQETEVIIKFEIMKYYHSEILKNQVGKTSFT